MTAASSSPPLLTGGECERYRERLFAAIDTELTAVDGVHEALAELDRRGIPSCVASSGTHEKLARTLGRTGLLARFEGRIHSASDVANGKPAPDLFLHAARAHGVPPQRCVVVEDSPAGLAAATAAGMPSVAYAAGFVARSHLEASAASVIDYMAELPLVLGG